MIKEKKVVRTYQLTASAVESLESITKRLSKEANIEISMGKILELLIFNAKTKSFQELTKK